MLSRKFRKLIGCTWAMSLGAFFCACTSTANKPIRQMVYASSAMKAAEKNQAEKRSPDLFRRAEARFWKAKELYLAKEYQDAGRVGNEARRLAEQAELDSEVVAAQIAGDDEE